MGNVSLDQGQQTVQFRLSRSPSRLVGLLRRLPMSPGERTPKGSQARGCSRERCGPSHGRTPLRRRDSTGQMRFIDDFLRPNDQALSAVPNVSEGHVGFNAELGALTALASS
jgi:hypothetical protein